VKCTAIKRTFRPQEKQTFFTLLLKKGDGKLEGGGSTGGTLNAAAPALCQLPIRLDSEDGWMCGLPPAWPPPTPSLASPLQSRAVLRGSRPPSFHFLLWSWGTYRRAARQASALGGRLL